MVQHPALPKENHPTINTNEFTDPEWNEDENHQYPGHPFLHDFGDIERDREGYHHDQERDNDRISRCTHECEPVDGLLEESHIVVQCEFTGVGFGERESQELDMGQYNQEEKPQNHREEKEETSPFDMLSILHHITSNRCA
ncbi:hypothetical protein SDC9_167977 [bioreactor metagenome]|uniref:Uncharacterized protein n=1 Tax=bioreactor metagenome TaxID=1076179 RepID=A0A645G190_9ZZZZ